MQPGLSTYSFPWAFGINGFIPAAPMQAKDLLTYAWHCAFRVVQFGDNCPLHLLSATDHESLKNLAEKNKIQIQVGSRGLTFARVEKYISICRFYESPLLRMVIDDEDYHPDYMQVKKEIRAILPLLKQAGVKLAIENHDRFPARMLVEIIESTDPEFVGICLDTANSIGAGEGIGEILPLLGPYTLNLHIKDFTIVRLPHKMGFTVSGCAAGSGMLNIPQILHELENYGRCETAVLELWSNPLTNIENTIRREQKWVDESINYLKSIMS